MTHTAIILAAGMGTRLRGEVEDYPKGFLRLGDKPIVQESVDRLIAAGISDIVIVTGHCFEYYDRLATEYDGLIRTLHNPLFAESGSMYSLSLARDAVDADFLLLESDLTYEPRALDALLSDPAPDAILISGPSCAGDEVWIETKADNLVAMSKDPGKLGVAPAGELVGISKISTKLFAVMLDIADAEFETSLRYDYETDCLVAAATETDIHCPLVADLIWSEIDDPSHLQRARKDIYPQIQKLVAVVVE
jgi:choline kinase